MPSILPKTWVAGEKVTADDINANFAALFKASYTAGEDISQNDSCYISAANTVKRVAPTGLNTPSAVSTSPSHISGYSQKHFPHATSGLYLHCAGGDQSNAAVRLYAQVRTMNAGETDFANGSEVDISQGNASMYDIAEVTSGKYVAIYQIGSGIKVVAFTVSGTTITRGSEVDIETSGVNSDSALAISKLDTDKALISYQRGSDQNIMTRVLSLSGTTITANTAVVVKAQGNIMRTMASVQLATDSVLIVYSATSNLFARTISVSGTTPTANAEQTLVAVSSTNYTARLALLSSTKVFMLYSDSGNSLNDSAAHLTISGSTVTKGSDLGLGGNNNTYEYFGVYVISSGLVLMGHYTSTSQITIRLLNTSGAAPTSLATSSSSVTNTAGSYCSVGITKVKPWTYEFAGSTGDADFIFTLSGVSSSTPRIGVAEAAIANAATGYVLHRFFPADNFSSLTAGSLIYADDTGQITHNSSNTAPQVGIAISTTKALLT